MYSKRFIRLLISMPVFAFGATLSIQSGIGVNAWDTFALGITNVLPIQYGTVVLLTGIFVLFIDIILKQPIGFGIPYGVLRTNLHRNFASGRGWMSFIGMARRWVQATAFSVIKTMSSGWTYGLAYFSMT